MEIFIIREGRQTGPFGEDAVRAFLTEGTARPVDMGWRKGMAEWRPLAEVLQAQREPSADAAAQPPTAAKNAEEKFVPATAKQKAFLKYLGAEFGENLAKERAALAVSDALETPKLQGRIRKWHEDKLRMHADIFQDEIDFRKANRTTRYLERIQTEGSDVLKDVTKAHVQVLVESLDKRQPGWEADPDFALWDHLLPAIGEHFPQLVQSAHKGHLKPMSAVRAGTSATRGIGAAGGAMPPQPTGTLGAMIRGVALGVITLGAIIVGHQYWQESRIKKGQQAALPAASSTSEKKETPSAPASDPSSKNSTPQPQEKLLADSKQPAVPAENPPAPEAAPPAPDEKPVPAPAVNAEKPAAPVPAEEKPAAPAPATPPTAPEVPAPVNTPPAAQPRTAVKLTQGIGVMLPNGQVSLPAGTVLRYLAIEGQNVRVSWNNNVFFVPAMATDLNDPVPAPSEPGATAPTLGNPPAPSAAPGASAAPKPKKPSDDL